MLVFEVKMLGASLECERQSKRKNVWTFNIRYANLDFLYVTTVDVSCACTKRSEIYVSAEN